MAKIAIVGYGSSGQGIGKDGEGYTYVVNDNVKVGQRLQVIATSHGKVPKKFVTTAVPNKTFNENSVVGKEEMRTLKENLSTKGKENIDFTKAYSGGELGASGEIKKKDVVIGSNQAQTEYTVSARALAAEKYKESQPDAEFTSNTQETVNYYKSNKPTKGSKGGTFIDYATPFLNEGDIL